MYLHMFLNMLLSLSTLGFEVNHPSHTNRCSLSSVLFLGGGEGKNSNQCFVPAKSHIMKVLFFEAPRALIESLTRTVQAMGAASHLW